MTPSGDVAGTARRQLDRIGSGARLRPGPGAAGDRRHGLGREQHRHVFVIVGELLAVGLLREEAVADVRAPWRIGVPSKLRDIARRNSEVGRTEFRDGVERTTKLRDIARRDPGSVSYNTAARRGVVGDGAPCIWNLSAEQLAGAIEIVDIYHANNICATWPKAIYDNGTDLADQWAKEDWHAELDAGWLRALVAALHTRTRDHARGSQVYTLCLREPTPDALSPVAPCVGGGRGTAS